MSTADDNLRALNVDIVAHESAGNISLFRRAAGRRIRHAPCGSDHLRRSTRHSSQALRRARPASTRISISCLPDTLAVVRCTVATSKDGRPGRFNNRAGVRAGRRARQLETARLGQRSPVCSLNPTVTQPIDGPSIPEPRVGWVSRSGCPVGSRSDPAPGRPAFGLRARRRCGRWSTTAGRSRPRRCRHGRRR